MRHKPLKKKTISNKISSTFAFFNSSQALPIYIVIWLERNMAIWLYETVADVPES